jgi:hypothetical protein
MTWLRRIDALETILDASLPFFCSCQQSFRERIPPQFAGEVHLAPKAAVGRGSVQRIAPSINQEGYR